MSVLPNHALRYPQTRPEPAALYRVQCSKPITFPRKSDLFQLRVKISDSLECDWSSMLHLTLAIGLYDNTYISQLFRQARPGPLPPIK